MKIDKRYRLHEVATRDGGDHAEAVRADGNRLIAVGTASLAVVPILLPGQRSGSTLPRLELGEDAPDALIAPRAIAEATRGSKGEGILRIGKDTTEVCAGDGKPWTRWENPTGTFPTVDEILSMPERPPSETHEYVEVCLDAEALVRVSRAIGADEAVRLRFLVNKITGRCDAAGEAHGAIEVRPVREPDDGSGILMAVVIS